MSIALMATCMLGGRFGFEQSLRLLIPACSLLGSLSRGFGRFLHHFFSRTADLDGGSG